MSGRSLLEMCVNLLDENGFRLCVFGQRFDAATAQCMELRAWTLATQRDVRLEILEPDTPGGFMAAMACRPASKSATAEAMMECLFPQVIFV